MPVRTVGKDAVRGAQADIVVTVEAVLRCDALEQFGHIAQQQRIVFVDDDGSGRMESVNVDETCVDSRFFDERRDLVGEVDELCWMLRLDLDGCMPERRCACERLHVVSSSSENARPETRSLQRSVSVS